MGSTPKQIVRSLLEDGPDEIRAKDYLPHLDSQIPSPEAELDGIARWVRDSGNATFEESESWDWDEESRILTLMDKDGNTTKFTGREIADSSPGDWRLNRLRGP